MAGSDEMRRILDGGVPEEALRFFGRWWQLETYLRELVYTELRCRYGIGYTEQLDDQALRRADEDQVNDYMASADASDPLAYLDAGQLLKLISGKPKLFTPSLLPWQRWEPNIEVLRELRNRVSHCRRPHSDDLLRLNQLLRDLESGAQRFFSSYKDTSCEIAAKDPFAKAWIGGKHRDAGLIEHARRDYWVKMRVRLSRRPWAAQPNGAVVSGKTGYLWHVSWIMESRRLSPVKLWERLAELSETEERIVHLLFANPYQVTATFASVDDPSANSDAVARMFEAVVEESEEYVSNDMDAALDWSQWRAGAKDLPRKVGVESLLARFDPNNAIDVFGTA